MTSQNIPMSSFEEMQKNSNKHPHFVYAVILVIAVGLSLIWYLYSTDVDFIPNQVHKAIPANKASQTMAPTSDLQDDPGSIQVNNVDNEFLGIDQDLNSL